MIEQIVCKKELSALKICIFCMFLTVFSLFYAKSELLLLLSSHLLFFYRATLTIRFCRSLQKSNCEQFAQVAHYKRVTVSDSLRLLMTKEGQKRFAHFHEQIALLLKKN